SCNELLSFLGGTPSLSLFCNVPRAFQFGSRLLGMMRTSLPLSPAYLMALPRRKISLLARVRANASWCMRTTSASSSQARTKSGSVCSISSRRSRSRSNGVGDMDAAYAVSDGEAREKCNVVLVECRAEFLRSFVALRDFPVEVGDRPCEVG